MARFRGAVEDRGGLLGAQTSCRRHGQFEPDSCMPSQASPCGFNKTLRALEFVDLTEAVTGVLLSHFFPASLVSVTAL